MSVEVATYISDLNTANPGAADPKSEGDDHLRLIKATLKTTFPNVTGAVTPTHTVINSFGTIAAGTFPTVPLTGITTITATGNITGTNHIVGSDLSTTANRVGYTAANANGPAWVFAGLTNGTLNGQLYAIASDGSTQFSVTPTLGATRNLQVTGSVAGNPTITASGGSISLASDTKATTLSITQGAIVSGTYTPTLTNVANCPSLTPKVCQYMRVGAVATVSGSFDCDPTTGGATATNIGISLPVASVFAISGQAGGGGQDSSQQNIGSITADVANARANLSFLCGNALAQTMTFQFTYLIV